MIRQHSAQPHRQKGFTLIETLIYIALFGMILTGVIVSSYPLFTNTERSMASVTDEGEAAFILRKFSWALNSAAGVSNPSLNRLDVTYVELKGSTELLTFEYDVDTDSLLLNDVPLNATRTEISNFTVELDVIDDFVKVQFDIGERTVGPVRYYLYF